MAITVNTTDTFEQWRVKTNQLGSDVDSNIAAVRADIASNVSTLNSSIVGNVSTINSSIVGNVNTILANIASVTGNIVTGNLTIADNVYGNVIKISGSVVLIGKAAGNVNAGARNAFLGTQAGFCNTNGDDNTFLGYRAGCANCCGDNNTFVGSSAGINNSTGANNSFFGYNAGNSNRFDSCNTFIGSSAGRNNDGGINNSFLGAFSGCSNTVGDLNTFMGVSSGIRNDLGSCNTFFGTESGYCNTSGCNNIFIGYRAGCAVTTGVNNTIIGNVAGSASLSNTVIIAAGSNVRAYIDSTGNVGIGTSSPAYKLDVNGSTQITGYLGINQNPTTTSDLYLGDNTNKTLGTSYNIVIAGNGYSGGIALNATSMQIGQNSASRSLTFHSGSSFAERMRVTPEGKLGVNTTNPSANLEVRGPEADDANAEFSITGKGYLSFHNSLAAGNFNGQVAAGDKGIIFSNGTSNTGRFIIAPWGDTPGGISINSVGNVGIGTNSPTVRLEVSGEAKTNTPATSTNDTTVATTAYVVNRIANDAPTKTGGGASGSWDINISGSAGSAGTAGAASSTSFFTQAGTGESSIGVQRTGSSPAYLFSHGTAWGLYSNDGGMALDYNRSSSTFYFYGTSANVTNVTTNQVLGAIAGAAAGAVGSYALLGTGTSGPDGGISGGGGSFGDTVAGSKLKPSGFWKGSSGGTNNAPDTSSNGDAWMAAEDVAISGTWRNMGYVREDGSWVITLWLRIS